MGRGLLLPLLIAVAACQRMTYGPIPDDVACRACSLELVPVLTIGDSAGRNTLNGRPTAVFAAAGRYWLNVLDAFPMIYDSATGELHQFGRSGEGPGEFRLPLVRALLPGDSILLSDVHTYHIIGPDLTTARTLLSPHQMSQHRLLEWPRRVLAVSTLHDRSTRTNRTLVAVYDMSGAEVSAQDTLLATPPNSGRGAEWASSFRVLGEPGAHGAFWISDYNTYRLVRHSATGEPQDTIIRRPDWFTGGEPMRIGGPDQLTTPHVIAHWVDDSGHLWVLASQPRTNTRALWRDVGSMTGMREVRVASLPADYQLNRTVIEVIDPAARRVLARHIFDGYIIAVLPDSRVASFVETADGVPVLTIHRLELRER